MEGNLVRATESADMDSQFWDSTSEAREIRGRSRQPLVHDSGVGVVEESDTFDPVVFKRTAHLVQRLNRPALREVSLRFLGEILWRPIPELTEDDQHIAYRLWAILSDPPPFRNLTKREQDIISCLSIVMTLGGRESGLGRPRRLTMDRLSLTAGGRALQRTLSRDAHYAREKWKVSRWILVSDDPEFTKRTKGTSTPYDSYTRGYGNGGKPKLPHEFRPSTQVLDRSAYTVEPRQFYTGKPPGKKLLGTTEYW
jgi:hypothetical protein